MTQQSRRGALLSSLTGQAQSLHAARVNDPFHVRRHSLFNRKFLQTAATLSASVPTRVPGCIWSNRWASPWRISNYCGRDSIITNLPGLWFTRLGRNASHRCRHRRLFAVSTKGTQRYDLVNYAKDDVFAFGPESQGLPAEILEVSPNNSVFGFRWSRKPQPQSVQYGCRGHL